MPSANKDVSHPQQSGQDQPLKNPNHMEDQSYNNLTNHRNHTLDVSGMAADNVSPSVATVDGAEEDLVLAKSEVLSREEVLKRRSRRVKQLARCYKAHYWSLMEELRVKYREYYWKYGKSPFKEDKDPEMVGAANRTEGTGESVNNVANSVDYNNVSSNNQLGLGLCAVGGCKSKAMAMTRFCHPHILSDSKQKLYKACTYAIKSVPTGPVLCGKPILRSTVPSYCPVHLQMAEKHFTRALKKVGLNVSTSSKLAPKFHVIVAEYVRQIQARRRAYQKAKVEKLEIKEEKIT